MAPGVALSADLRNCIIYMHITSLLDAKMISQLIGIPLRTVYRILSVWKATGEVKPEAQGKQGRPRTLDFADTQFLMSSVTLESDRYLDELRDMLEERCGVRVSEATIWRTLNRVGFRLKEVCNRDSSSTERD
ncbi:Homeodomain-like protein [Schizopora paradoxa]|uniref:Homeodomain-like protein n=1 Tax=Schizopora paradoxa TaxID=27342 RepID=A0A0H2R010_9AGAM|nr:Homeodomain-like protein [Schizopora paradoxa]